MKRLMVVLFLLLFLMLPALAEEDEGWYLFDDEEGAALLFGVEKPAETPAPAAESEARADFIERIIALGKELYEKADGKAQRAHYKGDIYLSKNFTTHLFRENRGDFCMAEYPEVELKIPDNLPSADCKPYKYGLAWKEVAASDGNPFIEAAAFRYDSSLSKEENLTLACDFMRQVQRGDFFQMSADYEYGVGAHSAIMLGYDAETDEIHWMDSNMRGGKRNGIRYGLAQFDEVKSVTWWASAFCVKGRGATLYRLRDDIIYREGHEP